MHLSPGPLFVRQCSHTYISELHKHEEGAREAEKEKQRRVAWQRRARQDGGGEGSSRLACRHPQH